MKIAMWILAGGILGWISYALLDLNKSRGRVASIIIGMLGGALGGNLLVPMFGASTDVPGDVGLFSFFIVLGSAAACLALANLLSKRFGV
ncbi:MAG: hypothetical protein ACRET6_14085 [Burkholderiales bacterium]